MVPQNRDINGFTCERKENIMRRNAAARKNGTEHSTDQNGDARA